jgi:hypothetical protein
MSARSLIASIKNYVREYVTDATMKDRTFLQVMKNKGCMKFNQGGTSYSWPVKNAQTGVAQSQAEFGQITYTATNSHVMADQPYARYTRSAIIEEEELRQNQGNEEKIFDLYKSEVDGLMEAGMNTLSTDVQSGNGVGRNMLGVNNILTTTATANWAGIAQTGNTFWQHEVVDGDAGPNTSWDTDKLERLKTAGLACSRGSGKHTPDFMFTTKTVFGEIDSALVAIERHGPNFEGQRGIGGSADKPLLVHGMELYWDADAEASVVRLYNSNSICFAIQAPEGELWTVKEDENPTGYFATTIAILFLGQVMIENPREFCIVINAT